jgi:phage virion morphogenesis protein
MAGTNITVKVTDSGVAAAFARLIAIGGGLDRAALKNIGEAMVGSTQDRFTSATAPDGSKWKALNPEYAKGKKGPGILRESLQLEMSIVYQLSDSSVSWGTNKIYAAAQQFGAVIVPTNASALAFRLNGKLLLVKKVTLPARPYLGVSDADRTTMLEIVEDHILEVWK